MLNLRPYLDEMDDIDPGQTIRINHTDCEAGEDTRQRLYLTRTHADATVVVGYCHNCQQGGKHSDKSWSAYRNEKHGVVNSTPTIRDNVSEPDGLVGKLVDWPTDAKAWALSRRITQEHADKYGIAYDPSSDRVYLPKYSEDALEGYQLRAIHPWQRPKYLTASTIDAKPYTYIPNTESEENWAIIVEDLVSAIHVHDAATEAYSNKPGVYVLHGVKVDPMLMHKIANLYKWATIWLDNDNVHVIKQAELMERTIRLYSSDITVRTIKEESDPKHYNEEQIAGILDEVWYG